MENRSHIHLANTPAPFCFPSTWSTTTVNLELASYLVKRKLHQLVMKYELSVWMINIYQIDYLSNFVGYSLSLLTYSVKSESFSSFQLMIILREIFNRYICYGSKISVLINQTGTSVGSNLITPTALLLRVFQEFPFKIMMKLSFTCLPTTPFHESKSEHLQSPH